MKPRDLRRPVVIMLCCILAMAVIPSSQCATWHTTQSDSDSLGAPDLWHTNQTDSNTITLTSTSWHIYQSDSSGILLTGVSWVLLQSDANSSGVINSTWYGLQGDANSIGVINPGWYGLQSDSFGPMVKDPVLLMMQEDQLVYGENGTGVLNSTVPSVLFQLGNFGTALIGILFIGIMILAIVGRFR